MSPKLGIRSGWLTLWMLGMLALPALVLAPAVLGETVHHKKLAPFLELKLPGWTMDGKPTGTTIKMDKMQMSEVRATFRAGEKKLEIIIMDYWGQPIPFLAGLPQMEMESDNQVMRTTEVQGFKALEVYRPKDKEGELNISVADRFWVKIDGDGLDSPEILKTAARQMDLKKLAELAK